VLTCLSDVVKYNNIAVIVGSRTFAKEAYASGLRYKGVNYYLRNIDKDYMNNLIINKNNNEDNKFYFKQHNKYITKHTTIIHVDDNIVVTSTYSSDNVNTVIDNRRITLYYKVDHTFKVPKAHMIMLFKYYDEISMKEYHSELTLTTVQTVQPYMFMYIKRYVLFKLHDAVLCGNDITFTFIRNLGFVIRVNAYSDVLHTIVSDILSYVFYLASTSPNVNDIRHIINNNNNVNDSDNINDVVNDIIRNNFQEVITRGAKVIVISRKSLAEDGDAFVFNDTNEDISSISLAMISQYLAYYTALEKKTDIDKPRNLAKSVTVE
jgi:hypothetical protein